MNTIFYCDYCYENLNNHRINKSLGCGHAICNVCIDFLKRSFDLTQCPFDKKPYSRDAKDLPEHKASRVKSELCSIHFKPTTYYIKNTWSKACEDCVAEKHITRDNILDQHEINSYITTTLSEVQVKANLLSIEYKNNLEIIAFYESISNYADNIKMLTPDSSAELQENDIDEKLSALRYCEGFPHINERFLKLGDETVFEAYVLKSFSGLGIEREKRLILSDSNNYVWTGFTLSPFLSSGVDGYYGYNYRIESPQPVYLSEIGLGAELYPTNTETYLSILIKTMNSIQDITKGYMPATHKARITQTYRVNPALLLRPGEEFVVQAIVNTEKIYALQLIGKEFTFGNNRLIETDNKNSTSIVLYLKFKDA